MILNAYFPTIFINNYYEKHNTVIFWYFIFVIKNMVITNSRTNTI